MKVPVGADETSLKESVVGSEEWVLRSVARKVESDERKAWHVKCAERERTINCRGRGCRQISSRMWQM